MSDTKPTTVNRFRIDHAHIHRDWPPGQMDMVTASDYDALAAELAHAMARIGELAAWKPATQAQRIVHLAAALTRLTNGFKYSTEVVTIARDALGATK
jgi:hypothetical protein